MVQAAVYGEKKVILSYSVHDLLWRPVGKLVRFVAVVRPSRGSILLMSTDTSLSAIEIIRLYGLLQYSATVAPKQVWSSFGSWLRTIRPGIAPSEFVVAEALRKTLSEFLLNSPHEATIAKFILEHQNQETAELFRMAS